ncbi:MAG: PhzF family phenazine biosynthesis protein [Alphaproteobacteria bacterium]
MRLKLYQVDAFANRVFAGNPAAVVPLDAWLDDATLQAIATENNLSETAYTVPEGGGFRLRWFTPSAEVELCGHATLGTAHVLFATGAATGERVTFETLSGRLVVARAGEMLVMDFPAVPSTPIDTPVALVEGLGMVPVETLAGTDYMTVLADEGAVRALRPNMRALEKLDRRGVIVTARARDADFCSRFFAPRFGVPEDPVTGSAHCQLAPYWAKKLGKAALTAHQVSARGGELRCVDRGNRVEIRGRVAPYLDATITI